MKAETGGGWVCTALWGRQISHTILSSKRNLRAVTCLFWGGQSCSPPSHPLSSQPLSSQSIMEKTNHHELRAWHRQEFQNSWSLMDHSNPMQAPCKAAAPPLQHRQGRMRTASLGCLSRTLNHRKLGWLSVLLFIYYFARSTAPGCAITGFQTPLWAAPCCGLQLSAVLCTLVLQELQCSPTPTSTLAHLALQDSSTIELLWSPQFFSSWIPDAACKLHFLYDIPKMDEKPLKSELQKDTHRCSWGSAAHGDKTLPTAKGPIYPTQSHSSSTDVFTSSPSTHLDDAEPLHAGANVVLCWCLLVQVTCKHRGVKCQHSRCSLAKTFFHKDTACSNASHLLHYFIKSSSPSFLPPSTWEAWAMLGHLFSSNFS